MAYQKKTWRARQGAGLNKFSIGGANPVTLVNVPDSVSVQGDAFSQENMNDLENRIEAAVNGNTPLLCFNVPTSGDVTVTLDDPNQPFVLRFSSTRTLTTTAGNRLYVNGTSIASFRYSSINGAGATGLTSITGNVDVAYIIQRSMTVASTALVLNRQVSDLARVTGTLPVGNGGTGRTTIIYVADSAGASQSLTGATAQGTSDNPIASKAYVDANSGGGGGGSQILYEGTISAATYFGSGYCGDGLYGWQTPTFNLPKTNSLKRLRITCQVQSAYSASSTYNDSSNLRITYNGGTYVLSNGRSQNRIASGVWEIGFRDGSSAYRPVLYAAESNVTGTAQPYSPISPLTSLSPISMSMTSGTVSIGIIVGCIGQSVSASMYIKAELI